MADSNLNVNINGRDELSPVLHNIESRMIRFVGFVSSAIAAIKVTALPITDTAAFERELANVQKTTEFTDAQMRSLANGIKDLSLRLNVATLDLTKIAAAAGQQGLGRTGTQGILTFTDSVARMAAVLDITAEQAATDVGKIMNVFKLPITDVERIASAFNEVSNNSTASGSQLLDIVRRIGDAAGTINLQKSLGLAATGIDFGLSPEVVGTSMNTIFANMRSKAVEFGKIMKMSATDWIKIVDGDGISAFKLYLDQLRKMTSDAQAQAISKLSGQGRIFGLMNKFVQDTSNSVLNKNLQNADGGFLDGTSALKEQEKVLSTLTEQTKILKNSIFSLANDAGTKLVPQLTAYIAQLSAALQAPAMRSFMESTGAAMLDLVQSIASVIKFVASLNVNWENFVGTLKIFLALKLAEYIAQFSKRLPGVSTALRYIEDSANRAAAAASGLGRAGVDAAQRQVNGFNRMVGAFRDYRDALAANSRAEADAARARVQNSRIENDFRIASGQEVTQGRATRAAAASVAAASNAVEQARTHAAAANAAIQGTFNSRVQAATAAHQQSLAAIEASFAGRRSAADQANKEALIQSETRYFNRQLSGYQSYYTRRMQLVEQQGLQLIAQAEAEEARLTAVYQQAEARRLGAQRNASYVGGQLNRSDAQVRQTQDTLTRTGEAADRARGGLFNFGVVAGAIGSILGTTIRVLSAGFFWFTLLYTVLDALGITEKLPGFFQKLTDAIGLTSEASRKAAQESKNLSDQIKKQTDELKDLTDAFDKLKNKTTGGIDPRGIQQITDALKGDNVDGQSKAVTALGNHLRASNAEIEDNKSAMANAQIQMRDAIANLRVLQIEADKARTRLKNLTTARDKGQTIDQSFIDEAQTRVNETEAAFNKASEAVKKFGSTSMDSYKLAGAVAQQNHDQIAALVNGLFTDQSAQLFDQFVKPIEDLQERLNKLDKQRKTAMQDVQTVPKGGDDEEKRQRAQKQAEVDSLNAEINSTFAMLQSLQEAYKKARTAMAADGGLSQEVKNSIAALNLFSGQGVTVVGSIARALTEARQKNQLLTGELAPKANSTESKGNETFDPKQESEARKMARARIEFAKAQAAAAASIVKERNDQILALDQTAYDKGIIAIREYYENRRRLTLLNNSAEIGMLKRDLSAVETEKKARKAEGAKPSELLHFDTEITRINGQIKVLEEKRKGIADQTATDIERAYDAMTAHINSSTLQVAEALGVEDFDLFFSQNLEQYNQQYADFWAKLVQEGGEEGKKLVDDMQKVGTLEAIGKVFDKIGERTNLAYSELDRFMAGLAILQTQGKVTTVEFEAQAARARKAAAAAIAEQIGMQEQTLNSMATAGLHGTEAFKKLAAALEDNKLKLLQLQSVANAVATEINNAIKSGIQAAITDIVSGPQKRELTQIQQQVIQDNNASVRRLQDNIAFLERARSGVISGYGAAQSDVDAQIAKARNQIRDLQAETKRVQSEATESVLDMFVRAARNLGISVATSIRDAATKNLSEMAMRSIKNSMGGDGIGGAIANLLGSGTPGSSPSNPMFVKEADAAIGKEGALDKVFSQFKEGTGKVFDNLGDNLKGIMSWFSDGFSSVMQGAISWISDLFGGSSGGSSAAAQGIGAFFASMFHSGGVVGSTFTPHFAHPAMFTHAMRYHSGGIAGLQPDEVPAILRRGEEVLTANDPRHRANGGTGGSVTVNVEVNVESGQTSVVADGSNGRQLGNQLANAVKQVIANEKRPGGLLG